jgi:hypothetical protein
MHGGKSPGAPKGNRNGWKHGHYSAENVRLLRFWSDVASGRASSGVPIDASLAAIAPNLFQRRKGLRRQRLRVIDLIVVKAATDRQ